MTQFESCFHRPSNQILVQELEGLRWHELHCRLQGRSKYLIVGASSPSESCSTFWVSPNILRHPPPIQHLYLAREISTAHHLILTLCEFCMPIDAKGRKTSTADYFWIFDSCSVLWANRILRNDDVMMTQMPIEWILRCSHLEGEIFRLTFYISIIYNLNVDT